jgi:hypothetical protein
MFRTAPASASTSDGGSGDQHGSRACTGCSTGSKASYSSVAIRRNEAQMLRRFVSIDEKLSSSE